MRLLRPLLAGAGAVLAVAAGVGLVVRDDPSAPDVPSTPGSVLIADFIYGPATVQAAVGTTVTWTNEDNAAHTVTSGEDGPFDSGSIGEGATYEVELTTPGTYSYVCAFHPFMKGTVEVTG